MSNTTNEILHVSDEEKEAIQKIYNKTPKDIQDDIQGLKKWFRTQPHLPEVPHDSIIETYLITSKFSIEKTKMHLDSYYTFRSLIPDFFHNVQPKSEKMTNHQNAFTFIPLPYLTKDLNRIIAITYSEDADVLDVNLHFATIINLKEIRFLEDYCIGDILLCDLCHLKIAHFVKFTPTILGKMQRTIQKFFGAPIRAIHLINGPVFIEPLVKLLKSLLASKLENRVYVHSNLDSLYEYLDRELLPKDYGGPLPTLNEIKGRVHQKQIGQYADYYDKLNELKVDENLRPEPLSNDELLGFYGNFKQLNVD